MALIPESGTGSNPAADTFADVAYLRDFAAKRKVTVPAADADCEVLLIQAMDWIRAQEEHMKGCRSLPGVQPLPYPRTGVRLYGYLLASNVIPTELKQGQCQLAIDAQTAPLLPTLNAASERGPVIEKTLGPLTTKYAEPTQQRTVSRFAAAEALLAPLMRGGSGNLRVVRA